MSARQLIGRLLLIVAAAAMAFGLSQLNAPLRLAGPFNFPDPRGALAVALAIAVLIPGVPLAGWSRRAHGTLLLAAAAGLAALGALNQLGGSPDGGRWGDRYDAAEPVYDLIVYALAAAMAALGAAWAGARRGA